jgi:hypothetical protein
LSLLGRFFYNRQAKDNLYQIIFSNGFPCLRKCTVQDACFNFEQSDKWIGSPAIHSLCLYVQDVSECERLFIACPGLRWFRCHCDWFRAAQKVLHTTISQHSNLNCFEVDCFSSALLNTILPYMPNLTKLKVSFSNTNPINFDEFATILHNYLPKLTILYCCFAWDTSDKIHNPEMFAENIQKLHPLFQNVYMSQQPDLSNYDNNYFDEPNYHIRISLESFKKMRRN